jgi:hypothetical protein
MRVGCNASELLSQAQDRSFTKIDVAAKQLAYQFLKVRLPGPSRAVL